MNKLKLTGPLAASFTPFDERGEADCATIEKPAAALIAGTSPKPCGTSSGDRRK